ncbi:MAG: hypothetical protein EHM45_24530 [Desulfobacteraceae bacterium]|nr:MAG: hypothetical protein EHM45_24530 [Desulfobacteraceae bacterium]
MKRAVPKIQIPIIIVIPSEPASPIIEKRKPIISFGFEKLNEIFFLMNKMDADPNRIAVSKYWLPLMIAVSKIIITRPTIKKTIATREYKKIHVFVKSVFCSMD